MRIDQLPVAESVSNANTLPVNVAGMSKQISVGGLTNSIRDNVYGAPLTAATAAGMTDQTRVYVYTGNETGYVNGDWYYYNGTAWVSGGAYNSSAVQTDPTLMLEGVPADAKATGDAINAFSVSTILHGFGFPTEKVGNKNASPATGNSVAALDHSAAAPIADIGLFGKTEQPVQTTGKNLLPFEVNTPVASNGVTINILPDGGLKIVGTTTAQATYMFHADYSKLNLPAGSYRFLLTGSGTGFTDSNILLQLYTDTGSGLTSRFTSTDRTYTIGSDVTADYVRLRIVSGVTYDCVVYPMVMLSSNSDTTFEPYTGGMPAPNPLFPCPLESAGMTSGKNLLRDLRGGITSGGVTFTPMADGGLHIGGTASATTQYNPYTDYTILNIPHGMYRIRISGTGTGAENVRVQMYEDRGSGLVVASAWDNTEYVCIVRSDAVADTVRIRVSAGTYNCTVYPMIMPVYVDDMSFEPYSATGPQGTQIELETAGKNLLIPPDLTTPYTNNGITYSYDPAGVIVLNGTASGTSNLHFGASEAGWSNTQYIQNGSYVLSGGVSNTVYLSLWDGLDNTGTRYDDKGNAVTIQVTSGAIFNPRLVVSSGTVCNNLRVYPMLRYSDVTDATWEPYSETTTTLPTPNGLPGIAVSSGGNYTDENGQQWVCDTIDLAAGMYTKRCGTIPGYDGETIPGAYLSTTGGLTAGATVVYALATPVVTPLTEAQLQALKPMRTPLTTDGRITTNGTHPGLFVEYYEQLTHAFAANS